jgi:D-glycero-D-manno-heptose 1,7-bisphosphate phosphatase
MIYQAQNDYCLDLSDTCMIGDSLKDIQCARRAGCDKAIPIRTGHGQETELFCRQVDVVPDYVADDLLAAVKWLLANKGLLQICKGR